MGYGHMIPILFYFRKSKLFLSTFAVITVIFVIIAATPAGFPYKEAVAPKRYNVIHTNRVFHAYDGQVTRNESGFYVQPVDPRQVDVDDTVYKNANPLSYTLENCDQELYCGLPVISAGSRNRVKSSRWIPSGNPILPEITELVFNSKTQLTTTKVRFEFTVSGADRTVMYITPLDGAKVSDWSFNRIPLDENYRLPYFIYTAYATDKLTTNFWIELEVNSETWEGPMLKLAVAGHMQHHTEYFTDEFTQYLATYPEWSNPSVWIASLESWLF